MDYQEFMELDDLTIHMEFYIDRALFIKERACGEIMYSADSKSELEQMLKDAVTYSEIMEDYLALMKTQMDMLNDFKRRVNIERRTETRESE